MIKFEKEVEFSEDLAFKLLLKNDCTKIYLSEQAIHFINFVKTAPDLSNITKNSMRKLCKDIEGLMNFPLIRPKYGTDGVRILKNKDFTAHYFVFKNKKNNTLSLFITSVKWYVTDFEYHSYLNISIKKEVKKEVKHRKKRK